MVSAPGKRMGCCCFGASPSMRIVASWFGSNGSTVYKEGVAARILVFILNAGRAIGVAFGECRHALAPNDAGDHVGFGPEGVTLVEFCAITAATDAQ